MVLALPFSPLRPSGCGPSSRRGAVCGRSDTRSALRRGRFTWVSHLRGLVTGGGAAEDSRRGPAAAAGERPPRLWAGGPGVWFTSSGVQCHAGDPDALRTPVPSCQLGNPSGVSPGPSGLLPPRVAWRLSPGGRGQSPAAVLCGPSQRAHSIEGGPHRPGRGTRAEVSGLQGHGDFPGQPPAPACVPCPARTVPGLASSHARCRSLSACCPPHTAQRCTLGLVRKWLPSVPWAGNGPEPCRRARAVCRPVSEAAVCVLRGAGRRAPSSSPWGCRAPCCSTPSINRGLQTVSRSPRSPHQLSGSRPAFPKRGTGQGERIRTRHARCLARVACVSTWANVIPAVTAVRTVCRGQTPLNGRREGGHLSRDTRLLSGRAGVLPSVH